MSDAYSQLHATAAMRTMRAAESAVLMPELIGLRGEYGLCACVGAHMKLSGTPMLDNWVCLALGADARFGGSVHARSDEPLPFRDDTFRVIVLSHVLEWTPHVTELLSEATRILAPNGVIAITGVHPVSGWWPWLLWRARRSELGFSVIAPMWLRPHLLRRDIEVYATHRFGPAWPTSRVGGAPDGLGCYVLLGRKRRQAVTPLRVRAARSGAPAGAPLPTGAQRECA